jgi:protease-4
MTGIILPHRNLTPVEEARYRNYILDLYGDFTARVAANRNMDIERVEAVAQGRVYSGLGALNAGLIDSIGGLDDAVQIARKLAKIPDNRKVAYDEYPKQKFFDKMLDHIFSSGASGGSPPRGSPPVPATLLITDLFIPQPLLEDIRYRITHNGQVMPILPLGSEIWHKHR